MMFLVQILNEDPNFWCSARYEISELSCMKYEMVQIRVWKGECALVGDTNSSGTLSLDEQHPVFPDAGQLRPL